MQSPGGSPSESKDGVTWLILSYASSELISLGIYGSCSTESIAEKHESDNESMINNIFFCVRVVFVLFYIFVYELTTQLQTQRNGPATNATTTQYGWNGTRPSLNAIVCAKETVTEKRKRQTRKTDGTELVPR